MLSDNIPLSSPNAVENEEELDKDAPKGQDATHDYPRDGLGEERLLGDLSWDLIRSHRLLYCL